MDRHIAGPSRLLLVMALWGAMAALPARADEPAAAAASPDYNGQIAVIFKKYCLGCHNQDDAEHGLVLESYEALLAGGDGGAVLVAGKSDQSRLLLMLDGRAKPAMPPEGSEPPTADEIAVIKSWIDSGARGPSGAPVDPTLLVTPKVKLTARPRRAINALAWSPDGKLLALADYGEVRLLAADSRAVLRKLGGHRGPVTDVEFSADGSQLISAAGEPGLFGEVKRWNVADGALLATIVGHRDSLYAATLSPDGKSLATGGYDQQIKLWDTATSRELRTLSGHNGAVYDLAFSPSGKLLASASADRSVKLWDVASGQRLDTFAQPLKELYTVAFSPDGRHVVAGGVDNRLRVWRISESAQEGTNPLVYTRFAHEGPVVKAVFSRDGRLLASAAEDRTVKLWDVAAYTETRVLEPQPDWAGALAFGADNKSLAVGRADGSLAFYDGASGQPLPPPKPELTAVEPRGVERGVVTRVRLLGKNLLEARAVKASNDQVAVQLVATDEPSATEVLVDVRPAADLVRGKLQLSVTTPGGTSDAVDLHVDDIPQVVEAEPNDGAAALASTRLPACVWGVAQSKGDVDQIAFDAAAGRTIVFDLAAKSLGSKLNAVLTVVDPAGRVVAASNDFHDEADPLLAYRVPADGRYGVRVRDLEMDGSDKHFYRLAIGELPLVTATFPLSVPAGRKTAVELVGYNLAAGASVEVSPEKSGQLSLPLDPAKYRARGARNLLVTDAPDAIEAEPNDQPEQAMPITAPGGVSARVWARAGADAASDVDLYRFDAKQGQAWIIEVEASRRGSPLDSRIEVLDARGQPVQRLALQAVRDSYIEFRPLDSVGAGFRAKNWEEMELNEYVYLQGEVARIFRMPQGPDSDLQMYTLAGKRRCYFDTSATAHALDESVYIVVPQPPGAKLVANGLPVFPLYYANDDDADRTRGRDSRLAFTAPADGAYLVRVVDVRGYQGPDFGYRLSIRPPQPDFQVRLRDTSPTVPAGSGQRLSFVAERIDGFDGDITIDASGLPPGFSISTPTVIQAGHQEARTVLNAAADAPQPTAENRAAAKITAKAQVDGQWVVREVNAPSQIALAAKPKLIVRLEPAEVTIAPGTTTTALLKVERDGFDELITFEVDNLPHGVIVDNIGLNGVLIPAGQSERQIFLTAAKWVPDTTRQIHAVANAAGVQASRPITLQVRRPAAVAENK